MHSTNTDSNPRKMKIVVGTSLTNLHPQVWNPESEYYIDKIDAVMVSYAEFHTAPIRRKKAMEVGLRAYLHVADHIQVYLDNGAFAFWKKGIAPAISNYVEFVRATKPDWYPVPRDYIPDPELTKEEQKRLFEQTLEMNAQYSEDGYIPVVHAGEWLPEYLDELEERKINLARGLALGGLVPRLLTSKGASSKKRVVDAIKRVRERYPSVELHIFGIGGLTTLHLSAALRVDSVDSSGWRNRAARGLILVPGKGERSMVPLGNWRGKEVEADDLEELEKCSCPACQRHGIEGLKASKATPGKKAAGMWGFKNRATHNLWVMLKELEEIERHFVQGDYNEWYKTHVASPLFRNLIAYALNHTGYLHAETKD